MYKNLFTIIVPLFALVTFLSVSNSFSSESKEKANDTRIKIGASNALLKFEK